jgi:hypothetical protein
MEASAQRASLPGRMGQGRNASFQVSSGCRRTTAHSSWEACGQWPVAPVEVVVAWAPASGVLHLTTPSL